MVGVIGWQDCGKDFGDGWKVVEWVIINYAYKGCYYSDCDLLGKL